MMYRLVYSVLWLGLSASEDVRPGCSGIQLEHGSGTRVGNNIVFSCNPGFRIDGAALGSCKDGELVSKMPNCVKTSKSHEYKTGGHKKDLSVLSRHTKIKDDFELVSEKVDRKVYQRKDELLNHGKQTLHKHKHRGQIEQEESSQWKHGHQMQADQPPGLGRLFKKEIVGRKDMVLLDGDYTNDAAKYETEYEEGEETEYGDEETEYTDQQTDYPKKISNQVTGNDFYDYEYKSGQEAGKPDYEVDPNYSEYSDKDPAVDYPSESEKERSENKNIQLERKPADVTQEAEATDEVEYEEYEDEEKREDSENKEENDTTEESRVHNLNNDTEENTDVEKSKEIEKQSEVRNNDIENEDEDLDDYENNAEEDKLEEAKPADIINRINNDEYQEKPTVIQVDQKTIAPSEEYDYEKEEDGSADEIYNEIQKKDESQDTNDIPEIRREFDSNLITTDKVNEIRENDVDTIDEKEEEIEDSDGDDYYEEDIKNNTPREDNNSGIVTDKPTYKETKEDKITNTNNNIVNKLEEQYNEVTEDEYEDNYINNSSKKDQIEGSGNFDVTDDEDLESENEDSFKPDQNLTVPESGQSSLKNRDEREKMIDAKSSETDNTATEPEYYDEDVEYKDENNEIDQNQDNLNEINIDEAYNVDKYKNTLNTLSQEEVEKEDQEEDYEDVNSEEMNVNRKEHNIENGENNNIYDEDNQNSIDYNNRFFPTMSTTESPTSTTESLKTTTNLPETTKLYSLTTSDDEDLYFESSGEVPEPEGSGSPQYRGDIEEISEAGSKFRQEFFILHEIDILSLDATCMQNFLTAPRVKDAEVKGYDGSRRTEEFPGNRFAVVSYKCQPGHELVDARVDSLYCSQHKWVGKVPACHRSRPSSTKENLCQGVGSCDQLCELVSGQPVCSCHEGFTLAKDGLTCEDVDECQDNNGGCSQLCVNRPGTFMCECVPGFSLLGEKDCEDINECLLNNGHGPCQDSCMNNAGSYVCSCDNLPGTALGEDKHTCKSSAGCVINNGGCSHSCIDSYNQVFCMCPTGYVLGPDWKTCEDVNECEIDNNDCPQLCLNTPGSAHCECMPGFVLTNGTCFDLDECSEEENHCSHTCVNTEGSFFCTCQPGFELGEDVRTCTDIDECLVNNGGCDQVCVNTEGGRDCGCQVGFLRSGKAEECEDVDECVSIPGLCEHGDCINIRGAYTCNCHQGFEAGEGGVCRDMDECLGGPCGEVGVCENLPGSYECMCQPGYSFTGISCMDLDECLIGNPCVHGNCTNMEGGYECDCDKGFEEVEGTCLDIDECIHSPCGVGMCSNTQGSYACSCPRGYKAEAGGCHDADECAADDVCGQHGDCTNIPGSFHCSCHPGFELVSGVCQDIDECLSSPCIGGSCTNLPGGFECTCGPGLLLDEFSSTCIDVNECAQDNGGCHHTCINTLGSRTCTCESGFNLHPEDETRCEDKDECSSDNGGCDQVCVNTPGGHRCECTRGYTSKGRLCVDVDECAINNGGCEQECLNTAGGHECLCRKGFLPHPRNSSVCVDVDECTVKNGGCAQICRNLPGSRRCECRKGYQILPDKSKCGDLNECTKQNGGCSHNCTNVEGGHICSCPSSWDLGPDGRTCVEQRKRMCPAMKRPDHGFFKCTKARTKEGYEVGAKCMMKCMKGYTAEVAGRQKCMEDTKWRGDEGKCRPATCPAVALPANGKVEPASCLTGASPMRTRCKFSCSSGYKFEGATHAKCGPGEGWKYSDEQLPSCQPDFPPPFIMCPPDQTKALPQGSSSVYVMFPQPKTNVDWFRYVESSPTWAKQLEGEMTLGKHVLEFRARSPFSDQSASCQMVIHVKDTEPPKVASCPHSFVDYLKPGQKMKRITWKEPVFNDNVAIQHVMASYLPGHYFTEGRHHVLYQATDADGNRARCGFTITIKKENYPVFPPTPRTPAPTPAPPTTVAPPARTPAPPQLPAPIAVPARGLPSQCHEVPEVPNGRMACIDRDDSKKCTPVCNVGHVFYQKFSYRPPTYLCSSRRIDWKINRFIPDCSPVQKTKTTGTCPPGWEARDSTCIGCPPGMYRDTGSLCQLCPKGSFTDNFGSQECKLCSSGEYTTSLGSRNQSDCKKGDHNVHTRHRGVLGGRGSTNTGLLHYNSWLNEEPYRPGSQG